jgi:hypothetical protein
MPRPSPLEPPLASRTGILPPLSTLGHTTLDPPVRPREHHLVSLDHASAYHHGAMARSQPAALWLCLRRSRVRLRRSPARGAVCSPLVPVSHRRGVHVYDTPHSPRFHALIHAAFPRYPTRHVPTQPAFPRSPPRHVPTQPDSPRSHAIMHATFPRYPTCPISSRPYLPPFQAILHATFPRNPTRHVSTQPYSPRLHAILHATFPRKASCHVSTQSHTPRFHAILLVTSPRTPTCHVSMQPFRPCFHASLLATFPRNPTRPLPAAAYFDDTCNSPHPPPVRAPHLHTGHHGLLPSPPSPPPRRLRGTRPAHGLGHVLWLPVPQAPPRTPPRATGEAPLTAGGIVRQPAGR